MPILTSVDNQQSLLENQWFATTGIHRRNNIWRNTQGSTMPPLCAEANLPNYCVIWSGLLSKQGVPTILARAEPGDGVPQNSVHIVIVAMVLGGTIIFVIGIVVIYRLYMRNFDKKELSRQGTHHQSQKKDQKAKVLPAPKTSKTPWNMSSHVFIAIWKFQRSKMLTISAGAQDT